MKTLRSGLAATIAGGGIATVVLSDWAVPTRVVAALVVSVLATVVLLVGPLDPQEESALALAMRDPEAAERDAIVAATLRDISRRRNTVVYAIVGTIFLVLVVIGYGPWSH